MTGTRETLESFLPPALLAAIENRPRCKLYSLARTTLAIPGVLLMAQRHRCFHCGGVMPILGGGPASARPSREHVLPGSERKGVPYQAQLLAHKLCNNLRNDTPFTAMQWERAIVVWLQADRHWLEAGKAASPFLGWVEMARQRQAEGGR
jgi:hypothetical protein